jgi:hypothetical protein
VGGSKTLFEKFGLERMSYYTQSMVVGIINGQFKLCPSLFKQLMCINMGSCNEAFA